MSSIKENKSMHVLMYPWFALSHLTSFLRLANKLADKGHSISFFVPTKTQPKLFPHNHHPHLITFFPVTVPAVEGLPLGAETTNDVPASTAPLIAIAMDLTQHTIESNIAKLKPDLVFFDFASWLPALAREHGAKSVCYATSNLVRLTYGNNRARNLPDDYYLTEADLMEPPPGFPCPEIRLRVGEARILTQVARVEFGAGKITLKKRLDKVLRECDALASKTCREMEGAYIKFLEKYVGKPVLLAGPLIPDPPVSKLEELFDGWLKGFGKRSVVYCALGSECVLSIDLFHQLVLGLELTGRPFLAVLKPPTMYETIESALPRGFVERTRGRGIIHNGWVQQPLILQHPSIGCFVTHCGAGSLAEAILSECQLVLLPQGVDQFINARFMSLDLKIGVELEKREEDNFFTREDVCKAISIVMEEDSEIGNELRVNHTKLRQLLTKDGLEGSYINEFIQSLQHLLG